MTGKLQARGAVVDWEKVNLATEKKRTYEIELVSGGIVYKSYKPSEMKKILERRLADKDHFANKWKKATCVGKLRTR